MVYEFPQPINGISKVHVMKLPAGGLFDLFDYDTGECLNEGCPFPFMPTEEQVAEFVGTGEIEGLIENA